MRQQWTEYDERSGLGQVLNGVEREAIAHDRVTGFYRNPIDTPLNAYEQRLANDAMLCVALAAIRKHGPSA